MTLKGDSCRHACMSSVGPTHLQGRITSTGVYIHICTPTYTLSHIHTVTHTLIHHTHTYTPHTHTPAQVLLFDLGSAYWRLDGWRKELWELSHIGIPENDTESRDSIVFGFLTHWFIKEVWMCACEDVSM